IDPCAGHAGASLWRRGLVALAALAAAAMLLLAWQASRQLQGEARLAAVRDTPPPVAEAPRWSREDQARARAVNATVRQLNLPVPALLRALRPPPDIAVAVLSVELLAGAAQDSAGVRLTAEAQTAADMARYVAFVAERRPFVGAYLVRHETGEGLPG